MTFRPICIAPTDPGSPLDFGGNPQVDTLDDGADGGLGAMPTGDEAARLDMARLLGTDSLRQELLSVDKIDMLAVLHRGPQA